LTDGGRLGLRLALLGLAVGFAAVNTGNNLLYLILSLLLGLALVSAAAACWSLRRLDVSALLPEEVACGQEFVVGVVASGRFPLLPQTWIDVRLEGLPHGMTMSVGVPSGAGRGVASERVVAPGRGVYGNLSLSARTAYPLGLWSFRRGQAWRGSLVVTPRITRLTKLRVLSRADASGARPGLNASSIRGTSAGSDLRKIRQYTSGDDARHIDWRSSARTGRMMVREFEREQERRLDIVLDLEADNPAGFEAAVERCAAILDLARRTRIDARLILPGAASPLSGRSAMRRLAAIRPARDRSLLREALRRARPEAELVVVSSDARRATPLEAA